jgi:hypothetical protein
MYDVAVSYRTIGTVVIVYGDVINKLSQRSANFYRLNASLLYYLLLCDYIKSLLCVYLRHSMEFVVLNVAFWVVYFGL